MLKKGWHYTPWESRVWASTDRSQMGNRRRRPNPGGGEGVVRRAHHIGAQSITIAIKFQQHGVHLAQVPHQVRPGDLGLPVITPLLQIHLQAQGQKGGTMWPMAVSSRWCR